MSSDNSGLIRRLIRRLESDLTPEDRAELRRELEDWLARGFVRVGQFVIDVEPCTNDYLAVEIEGVASIQLKSNEDGVSVDVYPPRLVDGPVAAIWLTHEDLGADRGVDAC